MLLICGTMDNVESKVIPIFLACGDGLISSEPKWRKGRDRLCLEERIRNSVLSLFNLSLSKVIQLSITIKEFSGSKEKSN